MSTATPLASANLNFSEARDTRNSCCNGLREGEKDVRGDRQERESPRNDQFITRAGVLLLTMRSVYCVTGSGELGTPDNARSLAKMACPRLL